MQPPWLSSVVAKAVVSYVRMLCVVANGDIVAALMLIVAMVAKASVLAPVLLSLLDPAPAQELVPSSLALCLIDFSLTAAMVVALQEVSTPIMPSCRPLLLSMALALPQTPIPTSARLLPSSQMQRTRQQPAVTRRKSVSQVRTAVPDNGLVLAGRSTTAGDPFRSHGITTTGKRAKLSDLTESTTLKLCRPIQ